MPEPRCLRCDTQGYYLWGDILALVFIAGGKPADEHTVGRHWYDSTTCLLAMLRQDQNKCRFVIIGQALPGSALAGEVAWAPVLVRMFVGSTLTIHERDPDLPPIDAEGYRQVLMHVPQDMLRQLATAAADAQRPDGTSRRPR